MDQLPAVGQPAPDFTLPSHLDGDVQLSAMRGKKVAILFYPFDFSPGCTKEVTSFRDVYYLVKEFDAEMVAISPDHVWAHKAFSKSLDGIPYPLLADWGMAVTKVYGVHNPDRNCPQRTAFIVDREGVVQFVNAAFDPRDPGHYAQVLEELEKLP